MTLSPEGETSTTGPEPAPTTTPAPAKPTRRSRPRPPLFAGDPPPELLNPEPPSPPSPPGAPASASESPDAAPPRRRRRGHNASSDSPGNEPPPRRVDVKSRAQIKKAIAAGIRTAGARANAVAAARDDTAGDVGLWLTDAEDQEGLSDPLSAIAARHLGPDALNPDLGDALMAIVALFAYASKQLDVLARIRRARRTHVGDTAAGLNDQGAPAA